MADRLRTATPLPAVPGETRDSGFTLIEVLVALFMVTIVMASTTAFFVRAMAVTHREGENQSATQVATDAMEKMRGLSGAVIVTGHDAASVQAQWATAPAKVSPYLTTMEQAVDSSAAVGAGPTAPLPTVAQTISRNGLAYTQQWYVGSCWVMPGTTTCNLTSKAASGAIQMYRVVVSVSWPSNQCASNTCWFVTSTLVTRTIADPVFALPGFVPPVPTVVPTTAAPTITAPTTAAPTTVPATTAPAGPLPAAVWANRSTAGASPAALAVIGSYAVVSGLVHSNSDIWIEQSAATVTPKVEYRTLLTVTTSTYGTSPTLVKVTGVTAPPTSRAIAAYRPGGSAALAAGSGFKAITTCSGGTWTYNPAEVGSATIVHVPCSVVANSASISIKPLLVAEGTINLQGSSIAVGDWNGSPAKTGLISASTATPAIYIGGSSTTVAGNVQALGGGVQIAGSYTTMRCGILADTVKLSGSAVNITVDGTCL